MELEFVKDKFHYTIKFNAPDNILFIGATHLTEHYSWSKVLDTTMASDNPCGSLTVRYDATSFYKLFQKLIDGTLNEEIYNFIFPEDMKSPDTPLPIELNTKLPHDENLVDIKFIALDPNEIQESIRFDRKINDVQKRLEEKYSTIISSLEEKIGFLEFKLKTLDLHMTKTISEELTELKTHMNKLEKQISHIEIRVDDIDDENNHKMKAT